MTQPSLHSLRRARGFTLTEALVALLVLSIGLLGVAGLQLASLRASNTSAKRSQATFLAYDIIDRMRANMNAAQPNAYDIAEGANGAAGSRAGEDLIDWKANIRNTLPPYVGANGKPVKADGYISRTGVLVTVGLIWGDQDDDKTNKTGARTALRFEMRTRLTN